MDPKRKVMEDLKELTERINSNTAEQEESNRRHQEEIKRRRQELGFPRLKIKEREPTELELLLQKWEGDVQMSPAQEGEAQLSSEPEEVEPLSSPEPQAAIKGEELRGRFASAKPRTSACCTTHQVSGQRASRWGPSSPVHGPFLWAPEEGPTHPQARPWKRAKTKEMGLEGGLSFNGGGKWPCVRIHDCVDSQGVGTKCTTEDHSVL
ncbi:UNVERIFIED_CONTAM: hypothetical protein FKN15_047470 [Acipenser sinensis]